MYITEDECNIGLELVKRFNSNPEEFELVGFKETSWAEGFVPNCAEKYNFLTVEFNDNGIVSKYYRLKDESR